MDSKQKYTEAMHEESFYEVDDWFIQKLRKAPRQIGIHIANLIDKNYASLPTAVGWTQNVGGVCATTDEPFYFELEYLKQPDEAPIFLDIKEIDVDDYLDYILENKTLKLNEVKKGKQEDEAGTS
mgnify:CR=1 FL=1